MPNLAWRVRVSVPVTLPPMGWAVYTMGHVEGAKRPGGAADLPPRTIRNGFLEAMVEPDGNNVVVRGIKGRVITRIAATTVEDPWGSWGGMNEEPESLDLSSVRYAWKVKSVETLESGPERFVLAVRLTGGHSEMHLRLMLWRGRRALDVSARVLWNERSARLKLVFTGAGATAEFEVPGGTVVRSPCGEVPGGRWVRSGRLGFASDALYNFDLKKRVLRATVCRASRYANDVPAGPGEMPWLPVVDRGDLKFRFLLTPDVKNLPRLAAELERPPVVLSVPASAGPLPRSGTLLNLCAGPLELLAFKPGEDGHGVVLRVRAAATCRAWVRWLGRRVVLGPMRNGEIGTWRLTLAAGSTRLNAVEERR